MPQIIIPGPAGAEGRGARAPAGARAQAAADRRAAGAALERRICADEQPERLARRAREVHQPAPLSKYGNPVG